MKKFIKNNIKVFIATIISGIIFGGVGVYATSQHFAKDISFTPTNENFKKENGESITNVEDALNELYDRKNTYESAEVLFSKYNNGISSISYKILKDYKKITCFVSGTRETVYGAINNCSLNLVKQVVGNGQGWQTKQSVYEEYDVKKDTIITCEWSWHGSCIIIGYN